MIIARRRPPTAKFNATLVGAINGVNQEYLTLDKFDAATFVLYYNGQRLARPEDFDISESLGAGSGYDTVTVAFAPRVGDRLSVDYICG